MTTQAPRKTATVQAHMPSATPPGKQPAAAKIGPELALGAAMGERGTLGASGMLALQNAAGNRAVVGLVQAKAARSSTEDSARVHEAAKVGLRGTSGKLPHLDTIQRSFGRHDVTGVVAHTGAQAAAGAHAMGAAAFTTGNHVAFARTADLRTAAHEAAHIVQQRAGVQLSGGVGQVGDRYERHADAVAESVIQGRSAEPLLDAHAGTADARAGSTQRIMVGGEQIKSELEFTGAGSHGTQRRTDGTRGAGLVQDSSAEVSAEGSHAPGASSIIQRRVSVAAYTVQTPQNAEQLDDYIKLKLQYAQEEEKKNAARQQREQQVIAPLKILSVNDLQKPFAYYYRELSPPMGFGRIVGKLLEWANAKSPSEVHPDKDGSFPLVSTQDNHFATVKDLFLALVQNIRAEQHQQQAEHITNEVLANFSFYEPVVLKLLSAIQEQYALLPTQRREQVVLAGYASTLLSKSVLDQDLPSMIMQIQHSIVRLFIAINTIHSFIIVTHKLAKGPRKDIEKSLGGRTDKYSPFGPEIEAARRKGLAVWSGFSGSAADILNLGVAYRLTPQEIHALALLTATFFQILPTSKNPTHTFHEVMLVANLYFGVPYDWKKPGSDLPHQRPDSAPGEIKPDVKRKSELGENVIEVPMEKLISLHDVPRQGADPKNITNIRDKISKHGYDVGSPVSATALPNGDYLVTGGHHRIAAMSLLGQRTVPVKVYPASQTPRDRLAYFIGIARITGKYFHEWEPTLTTEESHKVNERLTDWKKHNSDQVKYNFQYQAPAKL